MFSDIAPRYDRANTILSLGIHRRWRRKAVRLAGPLHGARVLDVATGTGDLAFAFARAVGPGGRVVGVDFSRAMLDRARAKPQPEGARVEFEEADALALPFEKGAFDVATIGFGIRNVDHPARGLREMARVVRAGGRVVVLEFGQPKGLRSIPYRFYSRFVVPLVGGLVTGNRKAYEYLDRTSAAFPAGNAFLDLMRATGKFTETSGHRLSGGIAYVYVGTVA